jgi:hypothetical protein
MTLRAKSAKPSVVDPKMKTRAAIQSSMIEPPQANN